MIIVPAARDLPFTHHPTPLLHRGAKATDPSDSESVVPKEVARNPGTTS